VYHDTMAKYTINHEYFEHITTPEQAYILGFLWADGHVRKDGYATAIEINERDRCIVQYIREQLGSDHKIATATHNCIVLSLNSKQINSDLRKLGFCNRKTYSDIIPKHGRYSLAFIRGLIDGDGSIWQSGNAWSIQVTGNGTISQFLCDYFQCGGVYKDGGVFKWQAGGLLQMKRISQQLLGCQGALPKTRKVSLMHKIMRLDSPKSKRGPPSKLSPQQQLEVVQLRRAGLSQRAVGEKYQVTHSTIAKIEKRYEDNPL